MGWTNAGVKSMFDKYGDRINSIAFNNGRYLFIGFPSSPKRKDISFETIGGVDVIKIHHTQYSGSNIVEWDNFMTTEFIEGFDILDEPYKDFRIDPILLK